MHDTAMEIGQRFFETYFSKSMRSILDVGASNVNGSLRNVAPKAAAYLGADIEAGPGVDIILNDPNSLPFTDGHFDLVVSSSVFEHAEMFWLSFLEMLRVTRPGGYVYINAPSNGYYHAYPVDNWRFYPDSGLALESWAKRSGYSSKLIESFTAKRKHDVWNDFVMVFGRGDDAKAPPRLLIDTYTDAYNIRTIGNPVLRNQEARPEDMLLLDQLSETLNESNTSLSQMERDVAALAQRLQDADRRLSQSTHEFGGKIEQLGVELGKRDEQARALAAALEVATSERTALERRLKRYENLLAKVRVGRVRLAVRLKAEMADVRALLHEQVEALEKTKKESSELRWEVVELEAAARATKRAHGAESSQLRDQLAASEKASSMLLAKVESLQSIIAVMRASEIETKRQFQEKLFVSKEASSALSAKVENLQSVIAAIRDSEIESKRRLQDQLAASEEASFCLLEKVQNLQSVITTMRTNEMESTRRLHGKLAASESTSAALSAKVANLQTVITAMRVDEIDSKRRLQDQIAAAETASLTLSGKVTGLQAVVAEKQADNERLEAVLQETVNRRAEMARSAAAAAHSHNVLKREYQKMADSRCARFGHLVGTGVKKLRSALMGGAVPAIERQVQPLFDTSYYLEQYEDVRRAGVNALKHYLEYGWQESRNPNAWFDSDWYLRTYADVRDAGVNPLHHYILHGWKEGRNPSPKFDVDYYLDANDDVRAAGVEPLAHYLHHGLSEGRRPAPHAVPRAATLPVAGHDSQESMKIGAQMQPASSQRYAEETPTPRVALISSDSASPSHVYRIDNMARGLRENGCEVEVVPLHELWRIIDRVPEFHAVVIWRVAISPRFHWSADIRRIVQTCRDFGIATFFDVDDLVFDPAICTPKFVDGLRYLDDAERELYDEGVRGYRDMLLACGNALVTTDALRSAAEKFRVRTFVVPNGLDERYEEALDWPLLQHCRDKVVIGYTPGTRTHQKDFADAAAALATVLGARPEAQLWILGPLDLSEFPALEALSGTQVFLNPGVGRDKVFTFNQRIDINIIPLEADNPFTAAKSELKYFEAAVFGVPSVATKVGPYRRCIVDGENGYTATTEAEWHLKLRRLVEDRDFRHAMGAKARDAVAEFYRAAPIGNTMLAAIQAVRADMLAKANGQPGWSEEDLEEHWPEREGFLGERPLTINWIINGLLVGGGGHRMLLRAAYHLQRFGHRVRLYFTDTDNTPAELRDLIWKHFFPIESPIYIYAGTMKPADVVFATYWKTVKIALRHRDVCDNMMYFVQDFEPYFFPMGSDYIESENTYRQGLYAVTAGPWCAHFIRNQYQGDADSFIFPIEKVYLPGPRKKTNPNIVFFAKPEMPRRCYEIGVEVLREVHVLRPDVELILFGSREVHPERLPFPATCRNVLSVSELAQMYRDADIGLAFSPTNPSAVPFEMMACGLPVVDMARPAAEENFGGRFDLVKLASPVPQQMAEEIVALLDNAEERAQRSKLGLEFVATFPTEEEMGRRIEKLVVERVAASARSGESVRPTREVAQAIERKSPQLA